MSPRSSTCHRGWVHVLGTSVPLSLILSRPFSGRSLGACCPKGQGMWPCEPTAEDVQRHGSWASPAPSLCWGEGVLAARAAVPTSFMGLRAGGPSPLPSAPLAPPSRWNTQCGTWGLLAISKSGLSFAGKKGRMTRAGLLGMVRRDSWHKVCKRGQQGQRPPPCRGTSLSLSGRVASSLLPLSPPLVPSNILRFPVGLLPWGCHRYRHVGSGS